MLCHSIPKYWEQHPGGESGRGRNYPRRRRKPVLALRLFFKDQKCLLNLSWLQSFSTQGWPIFFKLFTPLEMREHGRAPSVVLNEVQRSCNGMGFILGGSGDLQEKSQCSNTLLPRKMVCLNWSILFKLMCHFFPP